MTTKLQKLDPLEYEWSQECPQCKTRIYGLMTHKGPLIVPSRVCECGFSFTNLA